MGGVDRHRDARRREQQQAATRGIARIPLSDLRDQSPPNLTALYADVQEGQALIPGIKMGIGALTVQRWDPSFAAAGWTLYGADLTLDQGHPFGSMFYRADEDGRVLRVGVTWHPPVQQLQFPALQAVARYRQRAGGPWSTRLRESPRTHARRLDAFVRSDASPCGARDVRRV